MKVLKYGEGYPKTCTCSECQSELAYVPTDVHRATKAISDNLGETLFGVDYITCPVCVAANDIKVYQLSRIEYQEPKPKKRWWQR